MNKNYLILSLFSVLFSGCATVYKKPYEFKSGITDYGKFPNFFFTESNSVSFNYTSIGSIYVNESSGFEVISDNKAVKKYKDDVTGTEQVKTIANLKTTNNFIPANIDKGLEAIYSLALKKGANGIINLKFSTTSDGYYITGMAIKK